MAQPSITQSTGIPIPGTPLRAGCGIPGTTTLESAVNRAAEVLRDAFGLPVEKRYNSSGKSGGAFVRCLNKRRVDVGISIMPCDGDVVQPFAFVDSDALGHPDLCNAGLETKPYAWVPFTSPEDAGRWIRENVNAAKLLPGGA